MPFAIRFISDKGQTDCCLSGRFGSRREAQAVVDNPYRLCNYAAVIRGGTAKSYLATVVWTP